MIKELQAWAELHGVSSEALAGLRTVLTPPMPVGSPGGPEAQVQKDVRTEAANAFDSLLWRNNNGAAVDASGRHIRYGLGNDSKKLNETFKSSDLIGVTPICVRGVWVGTFTAVEIKKPGWRGVSNARERAQNNYINVVKMRGGVAGFASSLLDYQTLIRDYYERANT